MVMNGERKRVVSFEDMEVFQRAYRISLDIHRASLKFPAVEQRALADQMRRASKSICANLAEGYGRQKGSKPEFIRFVRMAIGSSDEMRVWLRYARDPRLSRRTDLARLAGRISDDHAHAAELGRQGLTAGRRSSVVCRPSSVLRRGSGAFRRPVKVCREACWRYRKCEC